MTTCKSIYYLYNGSPKTIFNIFYNIITKCTKGCIRQFHQQFICINKNNKYKQIAKLEQISLKVGKFVLSFIDIYPEMPLTNFITFQLHSFILLWAAYNIFSNLYFYNILALLQIIQHQEIHNYHIMKTQFFFQISTLGYMTKTLNHIIFFFLHQNQNVFFSNIGNQNIFLEKKHNPPPLQVKWSVPKQTCANKLQTLF